MIKLNPVENGMGKPMLDLDILRSFVSVVETGGFTRAGERVHRTQSTVSQQIIRLEKTLGYPLLHRNGRQATPTEQGERLVSYARRILSLEQEAREVIARPVGEGVLRLGVPEDFAASQLTTLLSEFARSRPGLRLDVRCRLSVEIQRALERGELDLALYKRDAGGGDAIAAWPEGLRWVTSQHHRVNFNRNPVPLVMFDQGCLYRNRMIHAIEAAGRTWHVAYTSSNLPGIQAAVSVGLGVSILPETAILSDHRVLKAADGFPRIAKTELALVAVADASPATRRLAEVLAGFCSTVQSRKAARTKAGGRAARSASTR
jgi:DNA-binding transcriptional LysR family regulator